MVLKPANLLAHYTRAPVSSTKAGVVVSAGKMSKAVKVRVVGQEWNKHIRKYFPSPTTHLVADPTSSLVEGDLVRITSGWRTSRHIHHVVTAIISPFGTPATSRPPVLTIAQLMAQRLQQRLEKDVRSRAAGRLTSKWRLKEAAAAGHKIPELEDAMKNIRIKEEADAAALLKLGGTPKAKEGESTAKERRAAMREKREKGVEMAKKAKMEGQAARRERKKGAKDGEATEA